jgi:amidase
MEWSVLYLPIFTEGIFLSLRHLHALMGDGEIVGIGIEVGGEVKIEVTVKRDFTITTPMLLANNYLYVIVSKDTIKKAIKEAAYIMQYLIIERLKISFNKAAMFCSVLGNLEIYQIVDPFVTIRFALPLKLLGGIC